MMEQRKLTRSDNGIIAGVCAGIANYFDLDPTIIRVLYVLMFFFMGFGLMLYIILWLVIPKKQLN
ncbi:MAG: PspC domain-containing protein [Tannerellaceae bacterium]